MKMVMAAQSVVTYFLKLLTKRRGKVTLVVLQCRIGLHAQAIRLGSCILKFCDDNNQCIKSTTKSHLEIRAHYINRGT